MSKPVVGQCVNSLCTAYGQMVADEHEHDDRRRNAIPVGHGRGVRDRVSDEEYVRRVREQLRKDTAGGQVIDAPRGWDKAKCDQYAAERLASTPEGRRAMLDALAKAGVRFSPCVTSACCEPCHPQLWDCIPHDHKCGDKAHEACARGVRIVNL